MSAVRVVKIDSAVGILLAAVPLRVLVGWKLGSQRFHPKVRDRSVALTVRPQRHGLFSPPGKAPDVAHRGIKSQELLTFACVSASSFV